MHRCALIAGTLGLLAAAPLAAAAQPTGKIPCIGYLSGRSGPSALARSPVGLTRMLAFLVAPLAVETQQPSQVPRVEDLERGVAASARAPLRLVRAKVDVIFASSTQRLWRLSSLARNFGDVFLRAHAARRRGGRASFAKRTAKSRRVNVHWNGVAACW